MTLDHSGILLTFFSFFLFFFFFPLFFSCVVVQYLDSSGFLLDGMVPLAGTTLNVVSILYLYARLMTIYTTKHSKHEYSVKTIVAT